MRSNGEPLSPGLREHFEPHFGSTLHDVRIHRGREARAASLALRAQAFAAGSDIAWPSTAPEMHSSAGRALLAHELAHVIQQRGSARAVTAAGNPESERQARAVADGHAMKHTPVALESTRRGLALSVDEFIHSFPDLSSRSYSQLVEDVDQINEWMGRQISTTPESIQLEDALAGLRAEVARRNRNVAAKSIKPPRPKGKKHQAAAPDPSAGESEKPRVLAERTSIVFQDAAERKEELDRIVGWLQRPDVSKADRETLRTELNFLAPDFDQDRAKGADERHAKVIQQAIGMPSNGNTAELLSAMRRIDEIKPLSGQPGIQYMMKGSEMIRMSDETVAQLRASTGAALKQAAAKARSMNEYTFGRAQDFVQVNNDNKIVGFFVTNWSGLSPFDMWDRVLPLIQNSNMDVTKFRDMSKSPNASLASEAMQVLQAVEMAQHAREIFNETFDGAMDAGDQIVNGLKVVVAVSVAVELALVAAIAAPIVAAGAAGLGATGVVGGGLTILGTSGVTGLAGAGLGYSSTRLEGGSVEEAKANAWKTAKQGAVTGLGAGTTQVFSAALGVGTAGVSTAGNVVRSTVAQAGGNFVANATGTALEGGSATDSLKSGLIGAGTAVVAAPLGAAANSIESPALRTVTNMAISGGIGFGTGYALTGDTDKAWEAGITSAATAGVMSQAKPQKGPTWGQKKAFEVGRDSPGPAATPLSPPRWGWPIRSSLTGAQEAERPP